MKKSVINLAAVAALLAGIVSASDVTVTAGGRRFIVKEQPGQLFVVAANRHEQVLSRNIRINGKWGIAALSPDGRDVKLTVTDDSPARKIVRAEYSLSANYYLIKGSKPEPFDAAKLIVDYVFNKAIAGAVVNERLVALKPFTFRGWNIPCSFTFFEFTADGAEVKPYPERAYFKSKAGAYKVGQGAYLVGTRENGEKWYLGREFNAFSPVRDHLGGFYANHREMVPAHGRSLNPGESVTLSVAVGEIRNEGDLEKLRAMRSGDGTLPVTDFSGDWLMMPIVAKRFETKDYRPAAGLNWNGPRDLSFELKLAKCEDALRAHVKVTDELVVNPFTGKDVGLGDAVRVVFADAAGERVFDKTVSASDAVKTPFGYSLDVSVPWSELAAKGIRREEGVRFNLCVTDQDKGTDYENWMGIADGVIGGGDPINYPRLDFSGVVTAFQPERAVLPSQAEILNKIEAIAAANAKLPEKTEDEYTSCLKAMTDYFLDFMRTDLDADETIAFGHQTRKIDADYRYYMKDRINKNADYLIILQRELARRRRNLASGTVKPIATVTYAKGVRPEIKDGGFKVQGKELVLIGPDTWTNVKGWHNDDIGVIAATGFNLINCFYIGGTNYADVVRRCEEAGMYCAWGAAEDTAKDLLQHRPEWSDQKQNAHRNGMGYWLGSLVPSNPSPVFAYQISFPEQWTRKYEATEDWAKAFRAHLESKFGSLDEMNAALGSSYSNWAEVDFTAALKDDALKYESFVYRTKTNIKKGIPQQEWIEKRFGLPRSVHYSTHYNLCGLDPLVVLADFEALCQIFDIVGFDGGFGLAGSEFAIDFAKGGLDIDLARSFYPEKPIANNENHIIVDGVYFEYTNEETYLANILSYLMGMNAGSIWNWANTRHTYGEYAFTRANTYHETIRAALDIRRFPEEIAAFRHAPNPPFRIFHSLPSLAERDPYVRSLYGLYAASSFTGWPVRFLSERDLSKHDTKDAKVIVVPDARRVSETTFEALAVFAAKGGIVLVDGDEALTKDEWGKVVPERAAKLNRLRKFAETSSRTRFESLNTALAEKGEKPPLAVTTAGGKAPFGVMWRTAKTAAGTKVAFIANLAKTPVTVNIAKSGRAGGWTELLNGRDVSGEVVLKPMDVLLLKN